MVDVLPAREEGSQAGRTHNKKAAGSFPSSGSKPILDKLSLFPGPESSATKKSSGMIRPRSVGPSRGKLKVRGAGLS